MTADKIKELIATVDGVSLVGEFSIDKAGSLIGRIAVATGVGSDGLVWDVVISPTYPFKAMGREPIQFFNKVFWTILTSCREAISVCILLNLKMQRVSL